MNFSRQKKENLTTRNKKITEWKILPVKENNGNPL